MVRIGLQIRAQVENVTNIRPDGDDFRWYVKIKCSNCGTITGSWQYLTLTESTPTKGGRGSASMVSKCKMCGRENHIDILKDSYKAYNVEDSGSFKTIVGFECRGMEPVEFSPRIGFAAKGAESTTQFEVDLTEKEWADYDEKTNLPVSIEEFESRFITMK
ncbi:CXXC motif containing zinc binding protein-like [Patiria miniata]|uniref:CXXC motif containing zinc binding protein n=1 Tax=Patiria miniata TaxID=46514 RepID=A0A914AWM9_PATMI|nr:CXXC motif containing zinc binding protein-like [Patiria miniata]